jgi:hypothetical protein
MAKQVPGTVPECSGMAKQVPGTVPERSGMAKQVPGTVPDASGNASARHFAVATIEVTVPEGFGNLATRVATLPKSKNATTLPRKKIFAPAAGCFFIFSKGEL